MERLVLLVNHVVAAEPAAVERLRPHARTNDANRAERLADAPAGGRAVRLPRSRPPVCVEWLADAARPPRRSGRRRRRRQSGTRADAHRRRRAAPVTVSGDATFASDVDWLIDNLRWDLQDDLARFVGDDAGAPDRQGRRLVRRRDARRRAGAARAGEARSRIRRRAAPMRHIARLVVIWVTVLRYGLDELALSGFQQRWVRFLVRVITVGRSARRAARRAPAPRARAARPDLRQVRPGAVDPARPPAARHRRRARQAAGPRAAVSRGGRARPSSSARSAGRSTRSSPASTRRRWRARRSRRSTSLCLRERPRGRRQGAAARHARGDRRRRRADAPGRARWSSAGRPTAGG